MVLKDPYDRTVTNLRISLTSRCNLRCIYCHAEGEVNPEEQMSAADIAELDKGGCAVRHKEHQVYRRGTPAPP